MKAAPFRRRVEDAIEAARKAGASTVEITTADGSAYKFKFNAEAEVPDAEADDNSIRDKIRKWKQTKHETHPQPKVR
jgi:hypothetical protein